ncbi:uncharacterized protein LOC115984727 [Quercus lobata]|uniref:uncharacterized protein LOC115984727 n=1 Tax=Quercus lobata TaxID=97700 RepID=UPI0012489628|nr:uncharacterized protein LOC115984727 [Quercus lobata]
MCWNCRGFGNRQTVQELGDIIWAQDPTVVFLAETWLVEARLASICDSLHFGHYYGVSKVNHGGGLALFWKKDFNLWVVSASINHIDAVIFEGTDKAWRFTGFYGAPETHLRSASWNLLRTLHNQLDLPWLCGGDFNELLKSHEKRGGRPHPYGQMQKFREVLDECRLMDLGFIGKKFTWFKNYPSGGLWERLDRAISTAEWLDCFPATKVRSFVCGQSDHSPIFILPEGILVKPQRPWRFEQFWLEKEGCHDTVARSWVAIQSDSPVASVVGNIDRCQVKLKKWSKNSVGNIARTLVDKKKMLSKAEVVAIQGGSVDFFLQLKFEVNEFLRMEEQMWQQRSRTHWLLSGDSNTKYFHNRASHRFRRNSISELRDSHGVLFSGEENVSAMIVDFYTKLFSSSNPSGLETVVQHTKRVVSADMNVGLIEEFTRLEVETALKQMAPLKAPGPNGMPPIFFQHYWDSIGDDVVKVVLFCLNTSDVLPGLNHTFITLIPKVKSPELIYEFLPIALCNVLYKLVSKVLANRLKRVLPQIISESQSAFQLDKAISDNILVAFETLHHMKMKKVGKVGHVAIKLDMSKAYDRLEWEFLKKIMEKMGFHPTWVGWIMEYDSLLFCRARLGDVVAIQALLGLYEKASGQMINSAKTTLFFSKNVLDATKEPIKNLLGVAEIKEYKKYLGLPAVMGRNKKASLNYIKDRVWGKLQGWKEKLLSQAGKEVLLKVVVQAIPTFAMSCFRLPVGLCQDIEMLIRKFWWGQRGDRRNIHWKKWEVLCKPKLEGGLGFKDLCKFNEAMLAKQIWRLTYDKDSLFYKVFKAKYFPNGNVFEARSASGSFAWKSILRSKNLIERNARWRIGNGKGIQIFHDAWLPNLNDGRILFHRDVLAPDATVDMLIDPHSGWWNLNLIDQCFFPPDAKIIKSLPLCIVPQIDSLVWLAKRSGQFSVKSGYKCLCDDPYVSEFDSESTEAHRGLWKGVWRLNVPGKIKHFLWKCCTNALPTKENLLKRTIISESGCVKVRQVWLRTFGWLDHNRVAEGSFPDLVRLVQIKLKLFPLFAVTAWAVWHHRNKSRLQAVTVPLNQIAVFAETYLQNYSDCAGLGVVVRNSEGAVLAALSEKIVKPQSAELVEILAARRAVLFSSESGFHNSIFEGDSSSVIKLLQDRQGNAVAHALAQRARLSFPSELFDYRNAIFAHASLLPPLDLLLGEVHVAL